MNQKMAIRMNVK